MRHGDMPKTMSGTFAHIVRTRGLRGLYNGLSASLLRQITYSTTRFGIYEELKGRLVASRPQQQPSALALVALASLSGFVGGFAGNAADVLNVRMQHDAALPPDQRRNYRHALDGLLRMAREEGLGSWFRGVWPNSLRAAAMTASQLASKWPDCHACSAPATRLPRYLPTYTHMETNRAVCAGYDTFKRLLISSTPMTDNLATHFVASFLAGVTAATVTSPVDVIKTRVMSASGKSSLPRLLADIYAAEGLRWMFKGWVPSFLRLGP